MNAVDSITIPTGCRVIVAPVSQQEAPGSLFETLPEILDCCAAAKALSIPERTLRELARNGEIRGFKVGTNWRFTRLSLAEYVEQQEAILLVKQPSYGVAL